jgi:hypothetical protein
LVVAEVAAVQPDPAAGTAGELGGQAGRLLGSSVGDHRKRLVGHGDPSLRVRDGSYVRRHWRREGQVGPSKSMLASRPGKPPSSASQAPTYRQLPQGCHEKLLDLVDAVAGRPLAPVAPSACWA